MNVKQIRVLLCSPLGNTGGIAQWTSHILNYKKEYIDNIKLSWFYAKASKRVIVANTNILIRIYYGIFRYIPFLVGLYSKLNKESYDIVHITTSGSISMIKDIIAVCICKVQNTRVVTHFRFGRVPQIFKYGGWEKILVHKIISISNRVIVIDKESFNTLQSLGYANVDLLPNPLSPQINAIISKYKHIERKKRTILFVGHVVPTKGIYELVEACRSIGDVKLRILGLCDNGTRDNIIKLLGGANSCELIEFLGNHNIEFVIKEMLSCDLFVLPTYTEGFPNVILESMACGCAIISSNVGAIPEMLKEEDGNPCGIIIDPRDVAMLKDAINFMLGNQNFKLSCMQNAKERVNQVYDMASVYSRLVCIWNTLCAISSDEH